MSGQAHVIVAGGTESMSLIPMGGNKVSPNPWLMDHYPDAYLGMGLTAENLAKKYGITREMADEFSLRSHKNAIAAIAAGKFKDEIVPVEVNLTEIPANNGNRPKTTKFVYDTDEGPRADTSMEALAKLKPAFHARGTVTAGNSSQTSDGAAAAVVMSAERARELKIEPMAKFLAFATAGVPPEEMGIGPAYAIPKALKLAGLRLEDIDVFELNEAFAAQALAVIKLAGIDPNRVNPNGGAIALGHPLGCTGAKLTASILRELERRNERYGIVTMCVGGGMGAAGILERVA
jgi:acetyl-CoA acyltransferase